MRSRVNHKQSRKDFNRRESKVHKKNNQLAYRGGIRL